MFDKYLVNIEPSFYININNYSFLTEINFVERISINNFNEIKKNDKYKNETNNLAMNKINNLIQQKSKFNDEFLLNVNYIITNSGRLMPKSMTGLQMINPEIRSIIQKNKNIEIDVVNCHPQILYNILLNEDMLKQFPIYTELTLKREKIYEYIKNEFYEKFLEDPTILKKIHLAIFYGESHRAGINLLLNQKNFYKNDLLENLINTANDERNRLCQIILDNNPIIKNILDSTDNLLYGYPDKKSELKINKGEYSNTSILIVFFCNYERIILEYIYYFLEKNNLTTDNMLLICDCIQIPQKIFNKYEGSLTDDLNNFIFNKTNFKLEFKVKVC